MFVKIVQGEPLIFLNAFLITTIAGYDIDNFHPQYSAGITHQDYDEFKGADPCSILSSNIQSVKNACNLAATNLNFLKSGEKLTFSNGYPKCVDAVYEILDPQTHAKTQTIKTDFVVCNNGGLEMYPIGKGKSEQGVCLLSCPYNHCESFWDLPNAV